MKAAAARKVTPSTIRSEVWSSSPAFVKEEETWTISSGWKEDGHTFIRNYTS